MSAAARAWLPETAFTPAAVGAALAAAFAGWSSQWCTEGTLAVTAVRRVVPGPRALSARQLIQPAGSAVSADLPPRGKRILLEAVLGADLDEGGLGEADHRLVDDLATTIVEDLIARVNGALPAAREGDSPPLALTCALDRGEAFTLHCPEALLVAPVKAACRAAGARTGPLAPRWQAVSASPVTATASLGRVALSMAELGALAIGDVLVFDRPAETPAELALTSGGPAIARGSLTRDQDRRALLL